MGKGFERCGRIERDAAQSVLRGARLADPAEKSAVFAVYARQKLLNVRRFADDFTAERLPRKQRLVAVDAALRALSRETFAVLVAAHVERDVLRRLHALDRRAAHDAAALERLVALECRAVRC